jgi:hypothetical protein
MSKKIKFIVSVFLIAVNLLIAFSHSSISINHFDGTDTNTVVNNYIKDNPILFSEIIKEYSSFKISTSLDNNSKQDSLLQLLSSKVLEYNIHSITSFLYNQIRKELSLQRKSKILFPFHEHG